MLSSALAAILFLTVLAPGDIRPIGLTRKSMDLAHQRLCSEPLSDLDFVMSDVNFKKTRRFTEYSGDISGRMLGALNATTDILDGNAGVLPALLHDLASYQKADGHFGVDQDLEKEVSQKRDMPILWGNGRMLLAIAQRLQTHPDPELLKVALKLGDYVISTRKYYGIRENFEGVGGSMASGFTTCYPSLIDGLVALGEVTGETRFLDEAKFIANLSLLDQEFTTHHSHGRLTAWRGMLDLDRITGRHDFTAAVEDGCKTIRKNYLLPVGGVTEMFDLAWDRDEGCSEADWVRVNYLLWLATHKSSYLDMTETVLRNHLLAVQFSNGGFGHTVFMPVKVGDKEFRGRMIAFGSESYWCCAMHGAQVLADAAHWAVTKQGDAIVINWLAEVETQLDGVTVTAYQTGPTSWIVGRNSKERIDVPVRLRVPGWSRGFIAIEGQQVPSKNGWVNMVWTGKGYHELRIDFSDQIRITGPAAGVKPNVAARVYAGPDLYCLPDAWVSRLLRDSQEALEVVMCAQTPVNGRIPIVVRLGQGNDQRAALVPIVSRPLGACRMIFKVKQVPQAEFEDLSAAAQPQPDFGEPMELRVSADGPVEVKLNGEAIYSYNGWHESPLGIVYLEKDTGHVEVKLTANEFRPAILGLIKSEGKIHATGAEGWTVRAEGASAEQKAPVTDIGGFGTPPWDYYPAQFAGSEARWIGPAQPGEQKVWIFEYDLK